MTFKCRYCGRSVSVRPDKDAPYYPFCSKRCRMAELANWFDETYRFSHPLTETAEDDRETEEPQSKQ